MQTELDSKGDDRQNRTAFVFQLSIKTTASGQTHLSELYLLIHVVKMVSNQFLEVTEITTGMVEQSEDLKYPCQQ